MRSIDFFDKGADLAGDRLALIEGDKRLTFKELQEETYRFAKAMDADGAAHQSTVALYAPNHWGVLVALLGLWRFGAKWIPVNARNSIDSNIQYLNYVKCERIFYHSSMTREVEQLLAEVPSFTTAVCLDKPNGDHPSLEDFLKRGEKSNWQEECDAFGKLDEIVGIFATGGTTGPSKGVNVTNLGWGTMLSTAAGCWDAPDVEPVCLVTAPLTHAAGPVTVATLSIGATQVILPGFDAGKVLEAIEKYKVTHIYLPPTALYILMDHPDLKKYDLSSLKIFLLVGSPVAPEKLRQAVEIFGPCMCQCYGQVESPMITTWLDPATVAKAAAGDHPERLASCGRATPHVRVGIMDDDGNLLPPGERGEIVSRGPLVSHSYFEKPEETKEVRAFGWHHTGDVAYRDEEGYFFIVDRKKDMIVTGGFNVYSAEVEACVMELPQILECGVIGIPHEKWGEAVTAICVLAEGASISEEDVIAHCKTRLGGVKAPKKVEFWSELPKTANNKMDKKTIRQKFWGDSDRNVG
ncbi:AMP-binding protein [Emcibacter sp.]|uniref:AMP-binding protein n=1 Tax=Emcibacter sp. TaxID=1979954 RepID=UPI002AA808E1|nr:AMP-binding protein [Emcibacter sp.]